MSAGGTQAVSWEGKGTGGAGSGLLGDVHCRGYSATSGFCSGYRVCCLDLVDVGTEGRGGLRAHALDARSFCKESGLLGLVQIYQ